MFDFTLLNVFIGQAYIESPEFAKGVKAISDFMEKNNLSECDKEHLKQIKDSLENMIKKKDDIAKAGLELSTVAAGLFETASRIMSSYKDQIPDLDYYKEAVDDTVKLAKKAYTSMQAILNAVAKPAAAMKVSITMTIPTW